MRCSNDDSPGNNGIPASFSPFGRLPIYRARRSRHQHLVVLARVIAPLTGALVQSHITQDVSGAVHSRPTIGAGNSVDRK